MKLMKLNLNSTEEQEKLLQGTYEFIVIHAEAMQSKAGNDMTKIGIKINNSFVSDYLLPAGKMGYKTKSFFNSIGKPELCNKEYLEDSDILKSKGICEIEINGEYPKVKKYIETNTKTEKPNDNGALLNDEIPF